MSSDPLPWQKQTDKPAPTYLKPKILVTVPCGADDGVTPALTAGLIEMGRDTRFLCSFSFLQNLKPVEFMRNTAIANARQCGAEWCIQIDRDVVPKISPLEMISKADADMMVLAATYGVAMGDGVRLALNTTGESRGDWRLATLVPAGCLCIRRDVWQAFRGEPLFRTVLSDDSLLTPAIGEDAFFCRECAKRGIKIWCYHQTASHFHRYDLTQTLCAK